MLLRRESSRQWIGDSLCTHLSPKLSDQLLADVPANIGLDEQHFQFFVEVVVERRAIEQAGDFAENASTGFLEPLAELCIGITLASKESTEYHDKMPLLSDLAGARNGSVAGSVDQYIIGRYAGLWSKGA